MDSKTVTISDGDRDSGCVCHMGTATSLSIDGAFKGMTITLSGVSVDWAPRHSDCDGYSCAVASAAVFSGGAQQAAVAEAESMYPVRAQPVLQ